MAILFSDLDNTMVFSHHREIGNRKIVVEHLDGREQSFMTEFAYNFFATADWLSVVPTTTRTEQQYNRIEFVSKFKYAIVCNGGKLLVNGKEDEEWTYETYSLTKNNYDSLEDAAERLSFLCSGSAIHRPDKYMVYAKCSEPEMVYQELIRQVDSSRVNVQRDGRKVYLFSSGITKGKAVERLMKKRKPEVVIAAGDNFMDVSMLNKADYAFVSANIYEAVLCPNTILIEDDIFSDGICKRLIEMKMKGII